MDLILPSHEWDQDKLTNLFLDYESEAIMKIPIDHKGLADSRFWRYNKKGMYTVKSAYWVALPTSLRKDNLEFVSTSTSPTFWPKIWKLNIPPKIKIFLWKAAHNAIATEANMATYHVPCSPRCGLCGNPFADTNHVLFFCQGVKDAWKRTKWWPLFKTARRDATDSMITYLISTKEKDEMEHIATKLWGIWKERCDIIHSRGRPHKQRNILASWT